MNSHLIEPINIENSHEISILEFYEILKEIIKIYFPKYFKTTKEVIYGFSDR